MTHSFRPYVLELERRLAPATFTVTNLVDSGGGSLRQAILDANATAGADSVVFSTSLVLFGSLLLTSGEIKVTDAVTITGPGAFGLFNISGNNAERVFNFATAAAGTPIVVNNLWMAAGKTTGTGGVLAIGAASATLNGCRVTDGSGTNGGGVSVAGGTLIAVGSHFTDNTASSAGGGISADSASKVTLSNCVVSTNSALTAGGLDIKGPMLLESSTVSGNKALNSVGAGIRLDGSFAANALTIRNSTISGNSALGVGGGIALTSFNGTLVILNSTITANTCSGVGGGGIARTGGLGVVNLQSSIVAQNLNSVAADLFFNLGASITCENSLIGVANKGGAVLSGLGNQTGTQVVPLDAKLRPLAVIGGSTPTHFPLIGSPIVDKGANPGGLALDQRGFPRVFNGAADVGAVELAPQTFTVGTANDEDDGNLAVNDISLREAMLLANASATTADTITFSTFVLDDIISLTLGEINIEGPVEVRGDGNTITGNFTNRIFKTSNAATGAVIRLTRLHLTGGRSIDGGAIFVGNERLELADCRLASNSATADGGAIYLGTGGFLVMDRSVISGNVADNNGGGIYFFNDGAFLISNSSIVGNSCKFDGGGMYFYGDSDGRSRIINSTISSNNAGNHGGGIFINAFDSDEATGAIDIFNSTIANNTATNEGGGIHHDHDMPIEVVVRSSIVHGNFAAAGDNLHVTAIKAGQSAIGGGFNGTFVDLGGNRPFGEDPQLGLLDNNGGGLPSHLPVAGSPVLHVGSNPLGTFIDQRGAVRNVNGIDMGAVERQTATTFVVTSTADESDGNLIGGDFALREAIERASLSGETTDTINFDPTAFAAATTIELSLGQLDIVGGLTVNGPDAKLTIDALGTSRIFDTRQSPTNAMITFSRLHLTRGYSPLDGGAVYIGNQAVNFSDGSVTNSSSGDSGGAFHIFGERPFTLVNSTLSGNTSSFTGGGMYVRNYGSFTIRDSTISNNSSSSDGGGIYFFGNAIGPCIISNSTLSGNTSGAIGGAITLRNFNFGTLTVLNSTITANTAAFNSCGGIAILTSSGTLSLESSIVSGNFAGANANIFSANPVAAKNSALGPISGFTINDQGGNLTPGVNLMLGPLAANGGPTLTHALLPGSPAINKGSNPSFLANDQRGIGFVRSAGATDIGAFEVQPPAFPEAVTLADYSAQRSRVTNLYITFAGTPILPTNPADAFELTRQGDDAEVGLQVTTQGSDVLLTFTSGPLDGGSLADGRYSLKIFASQIPNLDANDDGITGDDLVLVGDPSNKLFRLFGDSDGNGIIDLTDFGAFRAAFGTSSSIFSFDGSGPVDLVDFGQFRSRFGMEV